MLNYIKKNAYLVTTTVIFILSVLFAVVIFISLEVVGEINRTSVGYIYLGDKSEQQYDSIIAQEMIHYQDTSTYKVFFQEYSLEIDLNHFTYDASRTLTSLRKNMNNKAYFLIDQTGQDAMESDMRDAFSDTIIDHVDLDEFYDDILKDMQLLYIKKDYLLQNYLDDTLAETVLDQSTLTNIQAFDVTKIVGTSSLVRIEKENRFSLLDTLSGLSYDNNQLSIIASGMLGALDNSPLSGLAFEQNFVEPVWAEVGMNVRILQVNRYDFTFFNDLDYDLFIQIEAVDTNTLSFKLLGFPCITTYDVYSENQIVIPYQTITIYNEAIVDDPNVEITDTDTETTYRLLVQPGVEGYVVFFYRTETDLNGQSNTYRIYDEQYLAIDEIYYVHVVLKEVI